MNVKESNQENKTNAIPSQIEHLVVDSTGFLKNIQLKDIGTTLYTLNDVVAEIKDNDTRQRLQVLPYQLTMSEPNKESLKAVTDFAKKTGDFASLSAVDLKVLALTHMLELRYVGYKHLKDEPTIVKTFTPIGGPLIDSKKIVGFHCAFGKQKHPETNNDEKLDSSREFEVHSGCPTLFISKAQVSNTNDDDQDDDDWITPENFHQTLTTNDDGAMLGMDTNSTKVACLTTDFAMQNVLLHMGLNVVSIDGLLIHRLRNYLLRCQFCFKTTSVLTKRFCPHCGNESLRRVVVTVDEHGDTKMHFSRRKQPNSRGCRFSIPAPKGGKHGRNIVLFEDQRMPHNRPSRKAIMAMNPLDADFIVKASPFAQNDVTSRSALLGIRTMRQPTMKNPNACGKGKRRGGKKR